MKSFLRKHSTLLSHMLDFLGSKPSLNNELYLSLFSEKDSYQDVGSVGGKRHIFHAVLYMDIQYFLEEDVDVLVL